ncbi:hypothetical protein [Methylocystis sp. Sn-Cys]|uniref:hypothetical protein n=1 Tax=Methylocystis sp. Sn-Cys TaxID=1701263 RepID=UPI001923151A|nr:hypothetical protein [Methylocystis sp. Sn-Cys]MBL1258405.1 hypothetical protein [Methylocystis sp. Sn-Cys]
MFDPLNEKKHRESHRERHIDGEVGEEERAPLLFLGRHRRSGKAFSRVEDDGRRIVAALAGGFARIGHLIRDPLDWFGAISAARAAWTRAITADDAIQARIAVLDCFASLAMTGSVQNRALVALDSLPGFQRAGNALGRLQRRSPRPRIR